MKAASVWKGYEYAYEPGGWRRDKSNLPMHCKRFMVIEVTQRTPYYAERAKTVVIGNILNTEGTDIIKASVEVPARHLINFWPDYVAERQIILDKNNNAEAERKANIAAKERENAYIVSAIVAETGIPEENIGLFGNVVQFRKEDIKNWLELETTPKLSDNLDAIPSHAQRWLEGSATPMTDAIGVDSETG